MSSCFLTQKKKRNPQEANFCSSLEIYSLSWFPSVMKWRAGRVHNPRERVHQSIVLWMSFRKYPLKVSTWLEKGHRWVCGVKFTGNDPNRVLYGVGNGHKMNPKSWSPRVMALQAHTGAWGPRTEHDIGRSSSLKNHRGEVSLWAQKAQPPPPGSRQ